MRKIGYTFDGDGNHFSLVELSSFEMAEIERMMAERDIPAEKKLIDQWTNEFSKEIDNLSLPRATRNTIVRSLHQQPDLYRRDGVLLSFDEWAALVRSSSSLMRSQCAGVRNLGETGYKNLLQALHGKQVKDR